MIQEDYNTDDICAMLGPCSGNCQFDGEQCEVEIPNMPECFVNKYNRFRSGMNGNR